MKNKICKEQYDVLINRLVSLKCDSQWLFEDCVSRLALIDEGDSLNLVAFRLNKIEDSLDRLIASSRLLLAFADDLDIMIKRNQEDEV